VLEDHYIWGGYTQLDEEMFGKMTCSLFVWLVAGVDLF
jgi:hypothetical protein